MKDTGLSQKTSWKMIRQALIISAAGVILLSTLINIALLAVPLYSLQIFDRVLYSKSQETLWMLCSATMIICLTAIALDSIRRKIPRTLSHFINDRLLNASLEDWALRTLDKPSPDSPTGSTSQSGPGSLLKLSHLLSQPSLQGLADALFIPVFLLILFLIHPLLGTTMLIANLLFVSLTITRHYSLRRQQPQLEQASINTQRECRSLQQEFSNAYTMGNPHLWLAKVSRAIENQTSQVAKSDKSQQTLTSLASSLRTLSQIAIPTAGALLLIQQQISAGQLLASIIIASRCLMPFEQLISQWRDLTQITDILHGLKNILALQRMPKNHPIAALNGKLSITSVDNSIRPAVNIQVTEGECIAIIGPAGSGKSSLMQKMMGLPERSLSSGEASAKLATQLDEFNSQLLDRRWLHSQIGYASIPASPIGISIKDFISHLQSTTDNRIERATRQAGLHKDISRLELGYDTIINQDHQACGRGFLQKLTIARALFHQPRYLFLDEVDNNLDNNGIENLQRLLKTLQERGTTVIFITQRKLLIESSDKILLMDNGYPTFFGNHQHLSLSNNRIKSTHNVHTLREDIS
jgi:ATP-binding cassette, subfamily C, type I secretion system permease/ATPase